MGFKRKRHSNKDAPNLKRFRATVEAFVHSKDKAFEKEESTGEERTFKFQGRKTSRKEERKKGRKLKKEKKHAFMQHKAFGDKKKLETETVESKEPTTEDRTRKNNEKRKREREKKKEKKAQEKSKQRDEVRIQGLREANLKEDRIIKQLEKQLKMNKRKSKTLPKAFIEDGLDYLDDVVNPEKLKAMYDNESDDSILGGASEDLDSDSEAGPSNLSAKPKSEKKKNSTQSTEKTHSDMDEGSDEDSDFDEDDFDGFSDLEGGESDSEDEGSDERSSEDDEMETVNVRTKSDESSEDNRTSKGSKKAKVSFSSTVTSIDNTMNTEKSHRDNVKHKGQELNILLENGSEEDDSENEEQENLSEQEGEFDDDEEEHSGEDESDSKEETQLKEDIYGRLRDAEGNIVSGSPAEGAVKGGAYIPPGKRLALAETTDEKKRLEIERMKKKLKGLINRLSESNMQSISSQIEDMYRNHSRAYLTGALTSIIMDAIIVPELIPEKLVMEQAMLMAVLHGNVGTEVGASFLQSVIQRYNSLYSQGGQYGSGKEMENTLVLLSNMFNFSTIHSVIIFDLLKKLTLTFNERDIELILVLLRNVGFRLRKDDAAALKEVIVSIQSKAAETDVTQFQDPSRVKFMLEILGAVKNNNMRKIPNFDPTQMEHSRKLLRNYIRGTTLDEGQLKISLADLLDAEEKGKWWLVGSAWSGRGQDSAREEEPKKSNSTLDTVSDKVLELARKQRMNTDVRKNIFCIIMTCEDYIDAFEKLLKLSLKNQQEREIIHVIVDLCLQEKKFNQFYAFLAQKFCEMHRRFQMALQFNFWDRLKELSSYTNTKIDNLAKLLAHLIGHNASSLSMFKVVEFGDLDKYKVRLLKVTLVQLLQQHSQEVIQEVFLKIVPVAKLNLLKEGLKLFMQHFLLKKSKNKDNDFSNELYERINLAQKVLGAADGRTML